MLKLSISKLSILLSLSLVGLSGCGGGGGEGSSSAPPVSAGTPIILKGSAATGSALVNTQVQAKCIGSTLVQGVTSELGAYELSMAPPARLPCIVQVVGGPLGKQHAIVDINYISAQVNVTPLSELVVNTAIKGSTNNFFNSFGSDSVNLVTPTKLAMAATLAEVKADVNGTKMWQDRANNLVWIKVVGSLPSSDPWYRLENFTAPFGQDIYQEISLYMKDNTMLNQ